MSGIPINEEFRRAEASLREQNQLARASFLHHSAGLAGLRKKLARQLSGPIMKHFKLPVQLCLDGVDLVSGRRQDLVPPRYLNFGGDGDFEKTGLEFLNYFTGLCGLKPYHKVLEVGCGIGRMARPLTKYLTSGSYDGIDIVPRGIHWCSTQFTPRYANFRFHLADVQNREYNPKGKVRAKEYRFPFNDGEFDFVFLTSVFTHMPKEDMERYMGEIARTLRKNGKSLITFFLLNAESRELQRIGQSSLKFVYPYDGCWSSDPVIPENALAYDEDDVSSAYAKYGFQVTDTHYGAWCGRPQFVSFQDILLATKAEA
jgi:ubiquinone/menaquinone biosynthesis C-methylase UbiE